ncbi:sporulation lipoprotein, YhcN/YlaJ family [Pelagirhabdus alkalitolerans]|uniref:Sporulation lipoprotein, YhcN/YlaJ family n=1 Tax=Pelagirhabdus alkalitolerans TaxID=1612202 RepID=A0A1G6N6G8_9BACI|nr:YhcN/YlaJ family sporulation lipoprotein [Pelagirhabdus alkalitolerans]SDC63271.1 sporulation lipoprotein, YhcN/YlaJ family [Pelagirhabdus alkalitolerans]
MNKTALVSLACVCLVASGCGFMNTEESRNENEWDQIEPIRHDQNQMDQGGPAYDGQYESDQGFGDQRGQTGDPMYPSTPNQEPQNGEGMNDGYQVSDEISEAINQEVDEIDQANALKMGNTAYVACRLSGDSGDGSDDLSDEIEEKVTRAAKEADQDLDEVFVSTNPDFMNLSDNYMRDIERGEPIEGFFDQFGEMFERLFPTRDRNNR